LVGRVFIFMIMMAVVIADSAKTESTKSGSDTFGRDVAIADENINSNTQSTIPNEENSHKNDAYIDLLERTNSQLSLWYNPYAIIISILTLLFTTLTIIAAVIIYRQGSEFKRQREEVLLDLKGNHEALLEEYEGKHTALLKSLKKENEAATATFDGKLKKYEESLQQNAGEDPGVTKALQELKDEFESWKTSKNYLEGAAAASGSSLVYGSGFRGDSIRYCSKCGYGYVPPKGSNLLSLALGSKYKCPQCGNVDLPH